MYKKRPSNLYNLKLNKKIIFLGGIYIKWDSYVI